VAGSGLSGLSSLESPRLEARTLWWRIRRNPKALWSLVALGFIVLVAIFGPLVWTQSPTKGHFGDLTAFPSSSHPLGTDSLGRDTLARLLAGLRVTLLIAVFVESINVVLGVTVGLLAGYHGGWLDRFFSRVTDLLFAFPGLLLAILMAGVFGPSVSEAYGGIGRLLLTAGSLALIGWPLMARYVRGLVLSLKEREFLDAARALGAPDAQIIRRALLPNVMGIVVVATTLDIAGVIVSEAALSLLGLGVQPPGSSLGLMINDARSYMGTNALQVLFPGAAVVVLVLLFSFLGDALRDLLDPRTGW
jgi:oligopeptide transport system permease protein